MELLSSPSGAAVLDPNFKHDSMTLSRAGISGHWEDVSDRFGNGYNPATGQYQIRTVNMFVVDGIIDSAKEMLEKIGQQVVDFVMNQDTRWFFGGKQSFTACSPTPIAGTAACAVVSGQIDLLVDNPLNWDRVCLRGEINVAGSANVAGSVKPGWNFRPPLNNWKKPIAIKDLINGFPAAVKEDLREAFKMGSKSFKFPFRHGVENEPEQGAKGTLSVSASVGLRGWGGSDYWTAGAKMTWQIPGWKRNTSFGMGNGYGTGFAVEGGFRFTQCTNQQSDK